MQWILAFLMIIFSFFDFIIIQKKYNQRRDCAKMI